MMYFKIYTIVLLLFFTDSNAVLYRQNAVFCQQKGLAWPAKDTSDQALLKLFPNELGGLARQCMHYIKKQCIAKAYYGHNQIRLTIIDDALNQYQGIKKFNADYYSLSSPDGIIKMTQVRNGYRTIALIDRDSKQCSVRFIYENRFIIQIDGLDHQTPYRLWMYVELHKLNALGGYS